jgi:hypothetical protein
VGKFMGLRLRAQLLSGLRPALITIGLYVLGSFLDWHFHWGLGRGLAGWVRFAASAGLTVLVFFIAAFYAGLSRAQRTALIRRLLVLRSPASR